MQDHYKAPNQRIAFVLSDGKYKEVPTDDVMQGRTVLEKYVDRFFIRECGYLMEVSREDWLQLQRDEYRNKYLRRLASAYGEFNYHAFDTNDYSGEELIVDILTNVEDEVVRRIMMDGIRKAIVQLPLHDREMIIALFFIGLTERDCASQLGVCQQFVHKHKCLILAHLKKILEK